MRDAFAGATYEPKFDDIRLHGQIARVRDALIDGQWRTLAELREKTGDGEASISAQLRHLRRQCHGGYLVEKRLRGERVNGLYEYRISGKVEAGRLF